VLIIHEAHSQLARLHHLASTLRNNGIAAEVYPEAKKTVVQYNYAERKHIPFALFVPESAAAGSFILRDLEQRENKEFADLEILCHAIKEMLHANE